jgi:hypothetical protein
MNMTVLREYVSLEKRKSELAAELKRVTAEATHLKEQAIEEIHNQGVTLVGVDDRILEIKRAVFVSARHGREGVIEALRQAKLDQFIPQNYYDKQLQSFVRELAAAVYSRADKENRVPTPQEVAAALPDPLGAALRFYFGHELSNRAKPAKKGADVDDADHTATADEGVDHDSGLGVAASTDLF